MPRSQGLSNNPYFELIQPIPRTDTNFFKVHSNIVLGLGLHKVSVGVPVNILKAFLPSSILTTWPAHLNLLDLIFHWIY